MLFDKKIGKSAFRKSSFEKTRSVLETEFKLLSIFLAILNQNLLEGAWFQTQDTPIPLTETMPLGHYNL